MESRDFLTRVSAATSSGHGSRATMTTSPLLTKSGNTSSGAASKTNNLSASCSKLAPKSAMASSIKRRLKTPTFELPKAVLASEEKSRGSKQKMGNSGMFRFRLKVKALCSNGLSATLKSLRSQRTIRLAELNESDVGITISLSDSSRLGTFCHLLPPDFRSEASLNEVSRRIDRKDGVSILSSSNPFPSSLDIISSGAASLVASVISMRSIPGTLLASAMNPRPYSAIVQSMGTGFAAKSFLMRLTKPCENSSIFPISSKIQTTLSFEDSLDKRSSTGNASSSNSCTFTVYLPTLGESLPTLAKGVLVPKAPARISTMSNPTRARPSLNSSVMKPSTWSPLRLHISITLLQAVDFPTPGNPVRSTHRMIMPR
mmetsp:Transcript_124751/g.195491  ORF Transcript_124751/g.195491 Transcript_124751/m.195491 type:complete len:373 (+) Transcript_124751:849-1967(+)